MIIAIDGLDGSGKESLCKALAETIISEGIRDEDHVFIHSFPCYTNESGKHIKDVLSNQMFNEMPSDLKAYMVGALFAYNRAEYMTGLKAEYGTDIFKADSMIHIFDRYWASNVLYQGIGKAPGQELASFINLMGVLDQNFANPNPNRYYFLRHPYTVLRRRLDSRKSKSVQNDSYESDARLKAVYHLSEQVITIGGFYQIYDKVIDGSKPILFSSESSLYYEHPLSTLVEIILNDLKECGLIRGDIE